MTLALYGKSRRRQGGLLFAGVLAVLVAMLAGVATYTAAFAHHNTITESRECNDSWAGSASYVGGNERRLLIIEDVVVNGQNYATSWSTDPGDSSPFGDDPISAYSLSPSDFWDNAPSGTSIFMWDDTDNGFSIYNRSGGSGTFNANWSGRISLYALDTRDTQPGPGTNNQTKWTRVDTDTVTAPSRPSDCDRTIRIHKVVQGSGAPVKTFSYSISPAGITGTVSATDSDDHETPKNVAQTVTETEALSGGWSFVKYARKQGLDSNCSGSGWSDQGTVQGNGVSIPADSNDYTVCIYNNYTDPAALVLSSSACVIVNNVQYAQFHFLLPASTGVGQGAGGTLSGTYNDGAAQNFGPINEDTTPSNGHPDWTFTLPFGSGASVKVLTASTSTGWTWPATGAGHDKDTVSKTSCQPVVLQPGIEKVAADPGYSGGAAHWLIKVNNTANTQAVDVKIQDSNVVNDGAVSGGTCSDEDISDGEMICSVNAGATLIVPVKKAVSQQCTAGQASNSATISWKVPGSNDWTSLGTTSTVNITVPADTNLCDKPGITKTTTTTTTTDPAAVEWTVTVTNPAVGSQGPGTTQNVWIKDTNANVVSGPTYGGGANCTIPNGSSFEQELNSTNGVACSMPNSSTITFTVKPAGTIARTCEDQKFNNTAYLYIGSTTNTPLTAQGPEITLQGDPNLCPKPEVTFVKLICGPDAAIPAPFASPNPVSYDPNNLPQDCFPMAGWNFFTGTTWNGSTLGGTQATHTTGADGTVTHTMTQAEFDAAKTASGSPYVSYLVREEVRSPYTFGSLQCYKDYGGVTDNIEQVNFKDNPVSEHVTCIAYNKMPRVTVNFIKAICPSLSDVPSNQAQGGGADDRGGLLGAADPAANVKVGLGNIPAACETVPDWQFNTGTTWNGSALGGVTASYTTVANGISSGIAGVQHTLTAAEFMAAIQDYQTTGKSYFVQEVEQSPGYLFGAIKCYADHYLDDKIERVDFEEWGLPGAEEEIYCIAYNVKAEREITITKHFVDLPEGFEVTKDDYPTFVFDPVPAGFDFATDCTPSGTNPVTWTCTVPYDWNGTVTETAAPGWQEVTCQRETVAQLIELVQSLVEFQTLEDHFEFCNAPFAEVKVQKVFVGDFTGYPAFTFQSDLPGGVNNAGPAANTTVTAFDQKVALDTYSVQEDQALTQQEGCFGDNAAGYFTEVSVAKNGSTIVPKGEGSSASIVATAPGDQVTVTFYNTRCELAASPIVIIEKFADPAGNRTGTTSISGFQIAVYLDGVQLDGDLVTPGIQPFTSNGGPIVLAGLDPATVTAVELNPDTGGWKFTGAKTDRGDDGSFEKSVATQPAAEVITYDDVVRFNFYNQPRVNIEVNKTEISLATPAGAPGNGWSFTLTGCGVGPLVATTGVNGKATFTDLPPAVGCSYTVTETVKGGWSAINPVQVTAPTAAGQTAVLNFTNVKIEVCTNCVTTQETPTPTPTTPTATPTPKTPTPDTPTATPETPTQKPTEQATAGARTPGPGQTPIAPSTGNGFMGNGPAGVNMLLALIGLAALSLGTTILALGRKASRR